MNVHVKTMLDCPADRVWDEVQRSSLLLEIIRPLVRIAPADGQQFPDRWLEGETVRCRCYFFGIIPLGARTIRIERVDAARREIQSREQDPLIRRWDHRVHVRPIDANRSFYSDEIEIEARVLTFVVWGFAQWFYRHRQRKWRSVAQRLAVAN